jgi:hypothetical protein
VTFPFLATVAFNVTQLSPPALSNLTTSLDDKIFSTWITQLQKDLTLIARSGLSSPKSLRLSMLCKTCSTRISAVLNALIFQIPKELNDLRRTYYSLHGSFLSFSESITLGCCICRQIWASILGLQDDVELLTHALEGSVPATYDEFRHQVQLIQNSTRSPDSRARILSSSDSIRFIVGGESRDHFYMTVSIDSQNQPLCDFLFFPTPRRMDCLQSFGRSLFEVRGPSTNAMPDVWRHWLHNCSETHALCRALGQKQTFLPDRLIEIVVDENDNDILSWRLSYTIDQGSPCPLATLNPFGRELLLSDVSTGFKRSTWIQRIL